MPSLQPKPQILLTNDDGIRSPGLWAAAEALSQVGYVHVVAPRDQFTGAGRSLPSTTDGRISLQEVPVNGKNWQVYAVGGSPAQVVLHAFHEILPALPDLVVAGINFGENVGNGVTISGTVGAALQAATYGVPGLAVSLETEKQHHYSISNEVDFSAAAHFTRYFAALALSRRLPFDVDVLKVDVPCDAKPETPWKVTRLSRLSYFIGEAEKRSSWDDPLPVGYRINPAIFQDPPGTDIYALCQERVVSLTPLSLDLTSRTDLDALQRSLRAE